MAATAPLLIVAASGAQSPHLGPSLWMLIMMIAIFPLIKVEMSFTASDRARKIARISYGLLGFILFVLIAVFVK